MKFAIGILQLIVLIAKAFFNPFVFAIGVVTLGADMPLISGDPGSRIDAGFESHAMEFAHKSLYVLELAVGLDGIMLATTDALPSVINVDIGVTVIGKALVYHCLGGTEYFFLADTLAPTIPTVPAHGRSEKNVFTHFYAKVAFRLAQTILGTKDYLISPFLLEATRNDSCLFVQFKPFGKSVGRKGHGAVTSGCNGITELRLGAHAKHSGTVDTRCGWCGRSKDILGIVRDSDILFLRRNMLRPYHCRKKQGKDQFACVFHRLYFIIFSLWS